MTLGVQRKAKEQAEPCFQRCKHRHINKLKGFTYLLLLIFIAIASVGLVAISEMWIKSAEIERKAEKIWGAKQYANAVRSFYYSAPLGKRRLPQNSQELLEDDRFSPPLRHLREDYLAKPGFEWNLKSISSSSGLVGAQVLNKQDETIDHMANILTP